MYHYGNVITIAIGEIPEKTAELTANLYGLLGSNEEYKEYHHIGYDITANRIYENVIKYVENYNNNQKVFFITGARSAGGVANLLAKKLIDKYGKESVYAYTFNAVSTINGNMLPEGSKLPNLKYQSIMNIYNDDELMVMFTSEETNMYKYGTNVHMSLSENLTSKVKTAFREVHKSNYDKDMKVKVAEILNKTFNINLSGYVARVFGFTGTEWREWDSYTDEEIEKNNAKDLHKASKTELEELFNYWSEFYKVTKNNISYAPAFAEHAEKQITEIRNIQKDLGTKSLESNVDYVAQNKAQNNSTNGTINTPTNIPQSNNMNSGRSTYNSMLTCVEQLAKLYINHVGTYKKIFNTSEESINAHYCTNSAYEYLISNNVTIATYSSASKGFSVNAPTNENNKVYDKDSWLYYVYNNNSEGKEVIGNWYVRDDCSGFVKAAIKLNGKDINGFDTGSILNIKSKISKSLSLAKYVAYEYENGAWYKKYYDDVNSEEPIKELIAEMGIDFLEPGDILVTNGHAEIYVGNNYEVILSDLRNDNNRRNLEKKSYVWTNTDVTHTNAAYSKTNKSQNKEEPVYVKEGTFSWGNVKDEFPVESSSGQRNYFYYDSINNCFRLCECGRDPTNQDIHKSGGCSFKTNEYRVIWRKKVDEN